MRKVSEKSIRAFLNGKNGKFGGVSKYNGMQNTTVKDGKFYLFDNCIAKFEDGDLYVRIHTNSNTTRERLNTLSWLGGYDLSVTQRNWDAYINGKKVEDYMAWHKVSKKV